MTNAAETVHDSHFVNSLNALSDEHFFHLAEYAKFKMWNSARAVAGFDRDDLINEAIARTLDGRRSWNQQENDLLKHLKQSMSSIAYEWHQRAARSDELTTPELLVAESTEHAELEARQLIERLRETLHGNSVAVKVFDRMLEGYSASEIQEDLNIDTPVYDAARKKIYRQATKMAGSRGDKYA